MGQEQLRQARIAVTLLLTLCFFGWIILALHRVNYIPELFLKPAYSIFSNNSKIWLKYSAR